MSALTVITFGLQPRLPRIPQEAEHTLPLLALHASTGLRTEGDRVQMRSGLPSILQEPERTLPLLAHLASAGQPA